VNIILKLILEKHAMWLELGDKSLKELVKYPLGMGYEKGTGR
jgi:hypothetical protein